MFFTSDVLVIPSWFGRQSVVCKVMVYQVNVVSVGYSGTCAATLFGHLFNVLQTLSPLFNTKLLRCRYLVIK
jgi:hypothetical protein